MNAADFKNRFRVSRETFSEMVDKLSKLEKQDTSFREAIPLAKRIGIALYALGSSSEYRTVADLFSVGRSTVGEIVCQFCDEVISTYGNIFKTFYPPTNQKIKENVTAFHKMGFPQCYGAIDGCHIKVKPRKSEATDFFNFKGTTYFQRIFCLLKTICNLISRRIFYGSVRSCGLSI